MLFTAVRNLLHATSNNENLQQQLNYRVAGIRFKIILGEGKK